jgi:allophanate hydrolase
MSPRRSGGAATPLFGVEDNFDVAGVPTTAACPGFTYTPAGSAAVRRVPG